MTGCPEWRDAIMESALADAVEPALGAHLAACPGCADALRECRLALTRMDEAMHRRAAVEPPSYGPERVMARIKAGERGLNPSRASLGWRWVLAGGVMAALIASAVWIRRPIPQTSVVTLASWRSPTDVLLRPPVGAAWNSMPRVGEVFFEVKPLGETHAQ